jgi:hypothetical protein
MLDAGCWMLDPPPSQEQGSWNKEQGASPPARALFIFVFVYVSIFVVVFVFVFILVVILIVIVRPGVTSRRRRLFNAPLTYLEPGQRRLVRFDCLTPWAVFPLRAPRGCHLQQSWA